jgi:hypothetical protein
MWPLFLRCFCSISIGVTILGVALLCRSTRLVDAKLIPTPGYSACLPMMRGQSGDGGIIEESVR